MTREEFNKEGLTHLFRIEYLLRELINVNQYLKKNYYTKEKNENFQKLIGKGLLTDEFLVLIKDKNKFIQTYYDVYRLDQSPNLAGIDSTLKTTLENFKKEADANNIKIEVELNPNLEQEVENFIVEDEKSQMKYENMTKNYDFKAVADRNILSLFGGNGNKNNMACSSVEATYVFEALAKKFNVKVKDIEDEIAKRELPDKKTLTDFINDTVQNNPYSFNFLPTYYKAMGLAGLIDYLGWGKLEILSFKQLFETKNIEGAIGGRLSDNEFENYRKGIYKFEGEKTGHAFIYKKATKIDDYNYKLEWYDQFSTTKEDPTIWTYTKEFVEKSKAKFILSYIYKI